VCLGGHVKVFNSGRVLTAVLAGWLLCTRWTSTLYWARSARARSQRFAPSPSTRREQLGVSNLVWRFSFHLSSVAVDRGTQITMGRHGQTFWDLSCIGRALLWHSELHTRCL
jgi:hypothetical protein